MLFVGTSIIHPSTEGVFLLCNILDLLIYSFLKRIRQERELACDSAVLQLLKETEYKSYGNTLINFAETIAPVSYTHLV